MNEVKELILTPLLAESRFFTIWLIVPLLLIGGYELLSFFSRKDKEVVDSQNCLPIINKKKPESRQISLIAWIMFGLFCVGYVYLMFLKEDFAYHDNHQFTQFSLIGRPFYAPIWRDQGRFWPLGLQEYNFLALIGKNIFVYKSFSVLQLFLVILVVNKILSSLPTWYRLITITVLMVTPSFVVSFFGLIYPERNVIFWLCIIISCCQQLTTHQNKNPRLFLYLGLVAIQFCLYYKEPVFILLGSFLFARATYCFWGQKNDFKIAPFVKHNFLELAGLILCLVFLICYQLIVRIHVVERYDYNSRGSSLETLKFYLSGNFLISIFIVFVLARVIYLVFSKQKLHLIWDPLALGAVCYLLVFVRLKMHTVYYSAPIDLVAILSLSYFTYQYLINQESTSKLLQKILCYATAACLAIVVLNQNLEKSAVEVLWRKNLIASQVQLISQLKKYYQSSNIKNINLFFPDSTNEYYITMFSAYLEYSGLNLFYERGKSPLDAFRETLNLPPLMTNTANNPENNTQFKLMSPKVFDDQRCLSWFPANCFSKQNADAGDLIIILPYSGVSQESLNQFKSQGKTIYALQHQAHYSLAEKLLSAISKQDYSWMDTYIFEKD